MEAIYEAVDTGKLADQLVLTSASVSTRNKIFMSDPALYTT